MPTYRLDLSYDGSGFHGYAKQAGVRTVQGDLEEALFTLTGPVETAVAGRTDAGVHAREQVVSFSRPEPLDGERVVRSLNKMLADEIVVNRCTVVSDGFNARFSAVSRTYRYRILSRPLPDPLLRRTVWHIPDPLDRESMQTAAQHFLGLQDFASLCRKALGRGTVREVLRVEWREGDDGILEYEVSATSFCHQMVRSMVAICVDAGRGRLQPQAVPQILAARDRNKARGVAPPHGLTLWEVTY